MRRWPKSLPKLVVSLSMLLLLSGCLSPAQPDGDGGAGNGGQVDDPALGADWDTLLADLPKASFDGFWDYARAVESALRTVYAQDSHIVVSSEPPIEGVPGYRYTLVWRRYTQDNLLGVDPLDSAAVAQVEFHVDPAEGKAPSLAGFVCGDEYMGWSTDADVGATRDVVMRMWQGFLAGYSAEETPFWEAFTALHQVGATGHLIGAGGEFLLPGPEGYDSSLWLQANGEEDHCSAAIAVSHIPEGAFPSQPEDWGTLTSTLPQPGLGHEREAYARAMVTALRRTWAGQNVIVAQTGAANPTEGWQQETLTSLRFPVAAGDPGYVLETLTVRLTPGLVETAKPLATSMTVTELVAWDPAGYAVPQIFQGLVPARDLFLVSYLSVGDDFLEALKGLELTPGLVQGLPGPNGSKVQLTVEEVLQEDAALRVRYTLSYGVSSGQ